VVGEGILVLLPTQGAQSKLNILEKEGMGHSVREGAVINVRNPKSTFFGKKKKKEGGNGKTNLTRRVQKSTTSSLTKKRKGREKKRLTAERGLKEKARTAWGKPGCVRGEVTTRIGGGKKRKRNGFLSNENWGKS